MFFLFNFIHRNENGKFCSLLVEAQLIASGQSIPQPIHLNRQKPDVPYIVVRAVACECVARGPGFDSSSDQMVFFSPRVLGGRNKMDPNAINCMILHIHVVKIKYYLAMLLSGELV